MGKNTFLELTNTRLELHQGGHLVYSSTQNRAQGQVLSRSFISNDYPPLGAAKKTKFSLFIKVESQKWYQTQYSHKHSCCFIK